MNIGVLALQGGFAEHIASLNGTGRATCREIRKRADFTGDLDGLVIPGGESTVMANLLRDLDLLQPIRDAIRRGMPAMGTCAGLILLSADVEDFSRPTIGLLDVSVTRNAYGRQLDSFRTRGVFAETRHVPMVFIRAPGIVRLGPGVLPLASGGGRVVAVRQDRLLATAFHPELTEDATVHDYFLDMAAAAAHHPAEAAQ